MRRQTYGYPPVRGVVSSAHARDYFQRKETAVRLNAGHGVRGQVPRSNDKRINPIRPASESASEWMDVFTIPQIRPSSSVTIDLQTAGGARNADSHPHVTVMIRHATHTHTRLTALFPGLPGWAGTRKVKPIWILLKQVTVSGSGISFAIYKSAPRSRQITMTAPHHSVFYRPDALPAAQPTASKHWRLQALKATVKKNNHIHRFLR